MAKPTDSRSYRRGWDRGYEAGKRDGFQEGVDAFQMYLRAALQEVMRDSSTPLEQMTQITALIETDMKIVPQGEKLAI